MENLMNNLPTENPLFWIIAVIVVIGIIFCLLKAAFKAALSLIVIVLVIGLFFGLSPQEVVDKAKETAVVVTDTVKNGINNQLKPMVLGNLDNIEVTKDENGEKVYKNDKFTIFTKTTETNEKVKMIKSDSLGIEVELETFLNLLSEEEKQKVEKAIK